MTFAPGSPSPGPAASPLKIAAKAVTFSDKLALTRMPGTAMGGAGPPAGRFVALMAGHPNVLELRREPDEKATNFGAGWHSDWSFQPKPPAATILRSEVIPPVGGDTLFCDASRAWEALSPAMQAVLLPLRAVHSAARPYGTQGSFAKETAARTMQIISSKEAEKTQVHPLVRTHPVTGRKALWVSPVYTVGIEGLLGL